MQLQIIQDGDKMVSYAKMLIKIAESVYWDDIMDESGEKLNAPVPAFDL